MSEIERCSLEDIPALFELFGEVYKHNPRLQEIDYFNWQFLENPYHQEDEYSFWVERHNSQITGFLGYSPLEFVYRGNISMGCWTYNWYSSHSNGAGLKLMYKLWEQFDNRFYIGLSEASVNVYNYLRVPLLKKMPRWIGIIDSKKAVSLFDIGKKDTKEKFLSSENTINRSNGITDISPVSIFDTSIEYSFDNWSNLEGYVRRTGEFLNWRYFKIPGHNYKAIIGGDNSFAVYRIEKIMGREESVIKIIDWNFNADLAENALAYIAGEGLDSGAVLIDFFCTASDVETLFSPLGLFSEESIAERIPHLFRPLNNFFDRISLAIDLPPHMKSRNIDFSKWYISRGDGDIDRIKL